MRNIIIIINKYRRKLIIEYTTTLIYIYIYIYILDLTLSEKIYILSSDLMGPIVEKEEHLELI